MRRQTLADRLAEDVADRILGGVLKAGDALPPEPELASRYGVSRAVVRDATHLLAARGLVEVRHGKGVFVTASQREAFGDALQLSLRRAGATVWDLEQFEQVLFPAVVELVVANASAEEIGRIRELAESYLDQFEDLAETAKRASADAPADMPEHPFAHVLHAIYAATHNEVVRQIGEQLVALRRPRHWSGQGVPDGLDMDRRYLDELLSILESGDPGAASERVARLMRLPAEAVEAMRSTPIGEITRIDVSSRTAKPQGGA